MRYQQGEQKPVPTTSATSATGGKTSFLASDLIVDGHVNSKGPLSVHCQMNGDLTAPYIT